MILRWLSWCVLLPSEPRVHHLLINVKTTSVQFPVLHQEALQVGWV